MGAEAPFFSCPVSCEPLPSGAPLDRGHHPLIHAKLISDRLLGEPASLEQLVDGDDLISGELARSWRPIVKPRVDRVLTVPLGCAVFQVAEVVVLLVAVLVVDPCSIRSRANKGKHHQGVNGALETASK